MANLRSMVYDNSHKLNDSEKQIVQYVLNNPRDCSKLSLAKLAKKLYVSESAIFRLCKKLGLVLIILQFFHHLKEEKVIS